MVTLQRGLKNGGVVMILFGSIYTFVLAVGLILTLSGSNMKELIAVLWGIGGIVFIFTTPVFILGLGRIAAAANDVGKKARWATLISLPLGLLGVASLFMAIAFLIRALEYYDTSGLGTGLSISMMAGWMLVAASNYCAVGYLRDKAHLARAKKILIAEIWVGMILCVILSLLADSVLEKFDTVGVLYMILFIGPPIPLTVIGAVQYLSSSRVFKLPDPATPVRVIDPSGKQPGTGTPLLPFIQYDFSDTLTPEMFAKGFCFNCQAFVSEDFETCPKCQNEIERQDILRII